MRVANQVAFESKDGKQYRVVTMQGEIIERSGLMSGGGAPKKGLMGNNFKEEASQEQLQKMQRDI